MNIWRNQATDRALPEDQVVVLVLTMTVVKIVMTKTAEQNPRVQEEHQMAYHMKNLLCYLAE